MSTTFLMTTSEDQRIRVLAVIRNIPSGHWMSYGDVAKCAGLSGYHRWVVRVLREANDPHLPWHRVLRSDGRSGIPASSEGHQTQLTRLKQEGVQITQARAVSGRIRPDTD